MTAALHTLLKAPKTPEHAWPRQTGFSSLALVRSAWWRQPIWFVMAFRCVLKADPTSAWSPRASTFHPPTLDMLADLDLVNPLIAQGLIAPKFQYRDRREGLIAQFDFGDIADTTQHPFRLQCEQSKLTRIICDKLSGNPNFDIAFSNPVRTFCKPPTASL